MLINKDNIIYTLVKTSYNLIILYGSVGVGKKTTIKELAKRINYTYIPVGTKVDEIREITTLANQVSGNVLFVAEQGQDLTPQAQNALLKLTEEPPKNVRFVILTTDLRALLQTTRSRGMVFGMPVPTRANLEEYITLTNKTLLEEDKKTILEISSTFSDVNELLELSDTKLSEFVEFCNKVVENIGKASTLNAFKISNSIQLKPQNVGYNPLQFFKGVKYLIFKKALYKRFKLVNLLGIKITNNSINQLNNSSSPQMVLDNWIIQIKRMLKQNKEEQF
jgi:DNA polymerase III delta prime subunit